MNNFTNIINGITKTLELTEKALPLFTNYKKEISNVLGLFNKITNKKEIKKPNELPSIKKEAPKASTLTFFQ